MTTLRDNILTRLSAVGLSVNGLEKRAGLKQSAVQNIIYGRSKKPSASVVQAIARELGCTAEELLGDNPPPRGGIHRDHHMPFIFPKTVDDMPWSYDLFIQSVQSVQKRIAGFQKQPTKKQVIDCIDEIYSYSMGSKTKQVDEKFSEWLISHVFKE